MQTKIDVITVDKMMQQIEKKFIMVLSSTKNIDEKLLKQTKQYVSEPLMKKVVQGKIQFVRDDQIKTLQNTFFQ
jgi:hypothetical protein